MSKPMRLKRARHFRRKAERRIWSDRANNYWMTTMFYRNRPLFDVAITGHAK